MKKIAIIGAGISGLSAAEFLNRKFHTTIFEKESTPGGLIRCKDINGSLFHTCGGHVFNSKSGEVLSWFWSHFNKESFVNSIRNSSIILEDGNYIPYPIENHVYLLNEDIKRGFFADLDKIECDFGNDASLNSYSDFGDFLKNRFGKTLYALYFGPYNKKIWRKDPSLIPISWMEGKLPMPTVNEMRNANKLQLEETGFVHSSFWYENNGGSQYLADILAKNLDVRYNSEINKLVYQERKWIIDNEVFDAVLFCGNIKEMVNIIEGVDLNPWKTKIDEFQYHGTTSVFCEIDANPYSWIYLPDSRYNCHRIICTGNFSKNNNSVEIPNDRTTGTVEFTDYVPHDSILEELKSVPLHPKYLSHSYNKYTYPVQNKDTRSIVADFKKNLCAKGFFFTGRFADWEYYNMDVAVLAAMKTCNKIVELTY